MDAMIGWMQFGILYLTDPATQFVTNVLAGAAAISVYAAFIVP